jgi:hypothetical protein
MLQKKNDFEKISIEVFKYPYCGKSIELIEPEEFLSEKICSYTIKIRKKILRKTKRVFVYGQLILSLVNGLAPTQAIGLTILPRTPSIMRSIHSNAGLSKEQILAQVIQEMPAEIVFSKAEIDEFYNLAVECKNNSLSQEELIKKITNLRGGNFIDIVAALGLIGGIIILLINDWSLAFQLKPNAIIPQHLQWLYGNQQPGNHFGYGKGAGPRSITVTGAIQNAGSDKKQPSSGFWDYKEVMNELNRQSSKKRIDVQVGDQIYSLKNPYRGPASELGPKLADQIYQSIRECDTDICDIAQNLGFKADNIKNVKDHVFYNEHDLDRYVDQDEPIERKQFDPDLQQALAWKRLETGTHTQDDVTWIKHECAERHHELKYASGYKEAHDRAQSRFDGAPWEDQF